MLSKYFSTYWLEAILEIVYQLENGYLKCVWISGGSWHRPGLKMRQAELWNRGWASAITHHNLFDCQTVCIRMALRAITFEDCYQFRFYVKVHAVCVCSYLINGVLCQKQPGTIRHVNVEMIENLTNYSKIGNNTLPFFTQ